MSPESYCLEYTKPIFNELSILNVSNLNIQQTLVSMLKIVKDHSHNSVYDMFNFSLRDNFLVTLPSFRLKVPYFASRPNFATSGLFVTTVHWCAMGTSYQLSKR